MAPRKKVIGMVGLGYWGKNLLRNFHGLGVLAIASDFNEDTVKERRTVFPDLKYTLDYKDILKDPEIRAVVISTPASTHYGVAKEAILAGKDVFVEKPLALWADEGVELAELAARKNCILMVGHILHYHPAIIALKNLISKGALGKIQYVYSNRLNFGKIRREENILWSFAPHDISVIMSLLQDTPEDVSAKGSSYLNPEIADVTVSQLRFASGVNAHIFVSWLHPFKEQKLIVVGGEQMAVFDDTIPWENKLTLYPHRVIWENGVPVAKKAEGVPVPLEQNEPLKAECQHFVDCIEKKTKPMTDGKEGSAVLNVLNALQRSLDQKGRCISMNNKGAEYFAHGTAVIDEDVKIGPETKIWHFSHIMKRSRLGTKCNVGQNVVISPDVVIGDNVKIQNNVSIYTGVTIEDDVFLGPSMVFTNVTNPRSFIDRKSEFKKTVVKRGATIGANSTIVCGYDIGEYSFIGAGSVVTKDVPAYALVYGNPARVTSWVCMCGEKLEMTVDNGAESASCCSCGKTYSRKGQKVVEG